MYGEATLGEAAIGESPDTPELIIPEVGEPTKTLVFLIELDMLSRTAIDTE